MRVLLDEQIFAIQPVGGISRMFAELAYSFAVGAPSEIDLLPFRTPIVNRYVLESETLRTALNAREARNPWTALAADFADVKAEGTADVVHSTFYLPHGLRVSSKSKRVVTVHDMIPELVPHFRRRLDFLTLKRRYVETADQVICVSEATKQDLLKVYGLIKAPIHVVHHGVSPRFRPDVAKADILPKRYLLFVGHRHQYKDATVLFRAFGLLAHQEEDLELLCIGGDKFTADELTLFDELGIQGRVKQRFMEDKFVPSAYAHAEAFIFPSHFEGFGLPALEAMASGTPAILARATSLPEVGGEAAVYFEPGNHRELADVIRQIVNSIDLRTSIVDHGLRRAQEFDWRTAADRTKKVYESAMGE